MLVQTAIAALLGGAFCLDRVALQLMISRPVVAGPIVGLALGDFQTGLMAGAFVELLWIDRLPVGAYVPPHDTIVAVLAAAGAILSGAAAGGADRPLIAFCVLLYVPAGIAGQRMDMWLRRSNDRLAMQALDEVNSGNLQAVADRHLTAIARATLLSIAVIFTLLSAGVLLTRWAFPLLPPGAMSALEGVYLFLPMLGVGVALNTINIRGAVPVFCGVFLLLSAAVELL